MVQSDVIHFIPKSYNKREILNHYQSLGPYGSRISLQQLDVNVN